MPDTKITALAAITTVAPAADLFAIVDVSDNSMAASGTTKNITTNQILGAGGTATLASATITGDLTVDTSTLKVDSALNNVGIGTASPNNNTNRSTLTINNGTWGGQLDINVGATNHASFGTDNFDSGASCRIQSKDGIVLKTAGTGANSYLQLISSTGVTTWYDGAGGTRMTLNATGLGVGVASPAFKLDIAGSIQTTADVRIKKTGSDTFASGPFVYLNSGDGSGNGSALQLNAANGLDIWNSTGGVWSRRMTVDIGGNVGIGVTPNTGWQSSWKALDIGSIGGVSFGFGQTDITSNVYRINTGAARYKAAGTAATSYTQVSGTHIFLTAGVSTNANDPIAFNPSFTINASGLPIFLATTTTPATLTTNGELTFTATSNTNLRFSYRGSDGTTRVANITLA